MKVSSRDILAILKRFNIATDDDISRSVEHVTTSNPEGYSSLISFRFRRQIFYILFDDEAEDNPAYILKQIHTSNANAVGDVIKNPNEHLTQYALRFKGKDAYLFAVKSTKKRLDVHLGELYPKTSRSTWQKHIKAGHIFVNGIAETSVKYDIGEGDSIAVSLPDATDFSEHELPIVYIDENVIVINKPIGVLAHSKGALNDEFTVADFFRRYTTFGLDTNRPGIVHRLDRDTSGIMIGARNPETAALLQKQFASRLAKKRYIAILDGHVKQQEAIINLPIDRHPNAPSTFRVDAKGKQAVTQYRVLAEKDQLSLVELQPRTGRTHQLRVHMEYLGAPIRGDRVYGKAANRLFLHAKSLEVTLPSGQRHVFEAPMPTEFTQLFPEAKEL